MNCEHKRWCSKPILFFDLNPRHQHAGNHIALCIGCLLYEWNQQINKGKWTMVIQSLNFSLIKKVCYNHGVFNGVFISSLKSLKSWKGTNIEWNVQFPSCEPCMNNILKLVQDIKDLAIHSARVSWVVKWTYVQCNKTYVVASIDLVHCILIPKYELWTFQEKTNKYRESKSCFCQTRQNVVDNLEKKSSDLSKSRTSDTECKQTELHLQKLSSNYQQRKLRIKFAQPCVLSIAQDVSMFFSVVPGKSNNTP